MLGKEFLTSLMIQRFPGSDMKNLLQALTDKLGTRVGLEYIKSRGSSLTFFGISGDNRRCCVIKVVDKRREKIYRKINENLEEFVYLPPAERFCKEFRLLEVLSKQNLSPLPILVSDRYLVREYVEGELFLKRFNTKETDLKKDFWDAIAALVKMHGLGYCHGDPRPNNILIGKNGPVFFDFEHSYASGKWSIKQQKAFDILRFIDQVMKLNKTLINGFFDQILNYLKTHEDAETFEGFLKMAGSRDINKALYLSLSKSNITAAKIDRYSDNSVIESYDSKFTEGFGKLRDMLEYKFVSHYAKGLVLESGIGTGRIASRLVYKVDRLVGTDISIGMLKYILKRIEKKSIFLVNGELEQQPFKEGVFDTIISMRVLMHLPQYRNILNGYMPVLKKNGVVILDIPNGDHLNFCKIILSVFGLKRQKIPNASLEDYTNFVTKKEFMDISKSLGAELIIRPYNFLEAYWFSKIKFVRWAIKKIFLNKFIIRITYFFEYYIFRFLPSFTAMRYMVLIRK